MSPSPATPLRIDLPFPSEGGTVNAYLFLEPEPILVDTGDNSEPAWEALQAGLAAHGLTNGDLAKIVITHGHIDHFGNAARLLDESDAELLVLDIGAEWLTNFAVRWRERQSYYRDEFLVLSGLPGPVAERVMGYFDGIAATYRGVPADRVRTFADGDSLDLGGAPWKVMHTPGHASMHSCFYQPHSRAFLAGDMLLAVTPTPVVEAPPPGAERIPALPLFVDSLATVDALDIAMVYPGHGAPFENYRTVIQRQRQRLEERKGECLAFVREGVSSLFELFVLMYPGRAERVGLAGIWMVVGYLDLLQSEGLVGVAVQNGHWSYRVV